MKGKNVIWVTAILMATFFSCPANGQNYLGFHSPSLTYSPLNRTYHSVCVTYARDWPILCGAKINPWGKINGGIDFVIAYTDDHSKPAIAYNTVNDTFFIVRTGVWPYHDLYGNFLDYSSPDFLDPDQFMISDAPGVQANPIITRDSVSGKFLVTWVDDRNIDGAAIYGQLISVTGELEGSEFVIVGGISRENISWEYSKPYYSVAYDDANQRYLVVWNPGESIFGQFINANGTLYGEEFTIVEDLPDDYYPIGLPSLAYDGLNQRYLVVWDLLYGTGHTFGQLVSADGVLVGTQFAISTRLSGNPSVAFDNVNQRFLVAWTWGVTDGQFVNPDGTLLGDRLFISPMGLFAHDDPPAIAFNSDCGNFLVASVARDISEMKDLWAIKSDISYTVVGDPCPSSMLKVKMKGYGGKRKQISEAGMNCKKNICSGQYWPGSQINIDAWVDGKEAVATWTGCNTIEDNRCHITMDSDKNVTVKFTRAPRRRR